MDFLTVDKVTRSSSSNFVRTLVRERKGTEYFRISVSRSPAKQVRVLLIIVVHFLELFPDSGVRLFVQDHFRLSPTMIGMNKAALDIIGDYLEKVRKEMAQFLKSDDESPSEQTEVQLETISKEYPDQVLLLYGVSGSGKTTAIKHLLQKNWGYYLMPGNLNLSPQLSLHRREEYSKDSRFLWNLVENIHNILPETSTHQDVIALWSDRLLLSRQLIFDIFLGATAENSNVRTPAKWFQFQTSYSACFDPFESLFKLLLLGSSRDEKLGIEMPDLAKFHEKRRKQEQPFYWCLDEAQCYLDTRIPTNISGILRVENLLQQTLTGPLEWSKVEDAKMTFVVSGTSLKLQETTSTIEQIEQFQWSEPVTLPTKCHRITDLPLLTTDEHLKNLINKHGLLEKITSRDSLEGTVMRCGIPLRGRYLWSALYVNRLKIIFSSDSSSNEVVDDEDAVRKAASETIEEGKNYLKQRLQQLRVRKHEETLSELCWVVIQSDLLDRPTYFEKDRDHQMISEAFAVVETTDDKSLKGTLKESLAMNAAKEWFRDESKEMYYGKFNEYLRFSKNDSGSFGKATEWFLALVGINTHVRWHIY